MNSKTQLNLEGFRYVADKPLKNPALTIENGSAASHRRSLAANGLQITREVLPVPFKVLQNCLIRTNLYEREVNAYVYALPDNNAFCFMSGSDTINLGISSGLINNLDESELAFVFGHELGHEFYGHLGSVHVQNQDSDFLKMREMRAREISADRIGFLCADSVNSSVSAMIKLVSGVDQKHLLLDVGSYLAQCQTLEEIPTSYTDFLATHPPMPVRARALLWFSMSKAYLQRQNYSTTKVSSTSSIREVDEKVSKDINRYVDKGIDERFHSEKIAFKMFFLSHYLSLNGNFSKGDQAILEQHCGDVVKTLYPVIRNVKPSEVSNMLLARLHRPFEYLRLYSKATLRNEINECADILEISQSETNKLLAMLDISDTLDN